MLLFLKFKSCCNHEMLSHQKKFSMKIDLNTLFIWWVKCKLNGWIKAWKYVRGRHLQQKRHYWTFSEERPKVDRLILSSLSIQFGTDQFKRSLSFRCKVFCICSKYLNKLLEKCPNFSARISTVTKKTQFGSR